jgi:hypothetical protein
VDVEGKREREKISRRRIGRGNYLYSETGGKREMVVYRSRPS